MEPGHWPAGQSPFLAVSPEGVRYKGWEEVSAQALLPGCSQPVSKGDFPSESTNQGAVPIALSGKNYIY